MSAKIKLIIISVILLAGFTAFAFLIFKEGESLVNNESSDADVAQTDNPEDVKSEIDQTDDHNKPEPGSLKTFEPNQFKELFDFISLPNTVPIVDPPAITGNAKADDRIQSIAENRGYKLRFEPTSLLNISDGYNVQERVIQDWEGLKADAAKQGVYLSIVSGYRSVSDQRTIFLGQLHQYTQNYAEVAAGTWDAEIDLILTQYSIPGYSKHHTGYAIDIEDSGSGLDGFVNTPGYQWISKNNYENAKKHGFIPSYPKGATKIGPNPEPWEYVWVGDSNVRN